jgi:hypothetical protein
MSNAAPRAHAAWDDHHGVGGIGAARKRRVHAPESVGNRFWRQSQTTRQFFCNYNMGIVAEHHVQLVPGVGEIVQQPLGIEHSTGTGDRNEDSQRSFLMFGGKVYKKK